MDTGKLVKVEMLPMEGTVREEQVMDLLRRFCQNPNLLEQLLRCVQRVDHIERSDLPKPAGELPRLRRGGAYLITGGLGGIGLELAEYLARSYQAKLLLISREGLPAAEKSRRGAGGYSERNRQARCLRRLARRCRVPPGCWRDVPSRFYHQPAGG